MQNKSKQKYAGSVAFYDTRPGNEVGLFYNDPGPTRGYTLLDFPGLRYICSQSTVPAAKPRQQSPGHLLNN